MPIGEPLISAELKEELINNSVQPMCVYEGCGSADSWPEAHVTH